MLLKIGNYSFPVGQVEVLPSMDTQRDETGRPIAYRWGGVINGMMLADDGLSVDAGAANLSAYDRALRAATALTGQDLVLFDNLGARTSLDFPNNQFVLSPMTFISLNYPNGNAGEYVTKREFSLRFEVTYEAPVRVGTWTHYRENLQIVGNGGRVLRWQKAINGPPVPVQIYPETTIRVIVTGEATGYEAYPRIPDGPISSVYLINPESTITRTAPRFMGNKVYRFREYPVTWNFIYEGRVSDLKPANLIARPWPSGR